MKSGSCAVRALANLGPATVADHIDKVIELLEDKESSVQTAAVLTNPLLVSRSAVFRSAGFFIGSKHGIHIITYILRIFMHI